MVKEKLIAYQIYFSEKSKENCFSESNWWRHYNNTGKLTPFFENSCIADLIENNKHKESEYFAVFSHSIKSKISFSENNLIFNPENLRKQLNGHDVYSFQKRRKTKNIIIQANNYHPAFSDYMQKILNNIGFEMPKKTDKIVLFNHFIAKSHVYEMYYNNMLKPAMQVMSKMKELNKNSHYSRKQYSTEIQKQLGYRHYPYHPFICERLMSVWLTYNKDLTFKHIF